jgi:hypothetical protein
MFYKNKPCMRIGFRKTPKLHFPVAYRISPLPFSVGECGLVEYGCCTHPCFIYSFQRRSLQDRVRVTPAPNSACGIWAVVMSLLRILDFLLLVLIICLALRIVDQLLELLVRVLCSLPFERICNHLMLM